MDTKLRFYSQSSVVQDWKCPRSFYWGYEYGGTGLSGTTQQLELLIGQILHDGLAAIAKGLDINEIAPLGAKQLKDAIMAATVSEPDAEHFANEQAALVEGLLRGYVRAVWPIFQKQYPEILHVEKEMIYKHGNGLVFMCKPDLVVRDHEGALWYVEYKSTSSNKDQWINSWATAIQLHSASRAIRETIGEDITGVIVQGLYKGYVSYGKQGSPFCYGYYKQGNPPFTQNQWQYNYVAGWKKFPIWEREGGVEKWVAEMPEALLAEQFPQAPPIFVREHLVDAFFNQQEHRQQRIANAGAITVTSLDDVFPQRFDQCQPSFGKPCQFRQLCHGNVSDPLTHGFVQRTTEHREAYEKLA